MNAESFNVVDGNSYALQINSTTYVRYNIGATSNTGTGEVILPFKNSVSGINQDLIYLTGGSDLTFNATNTGTGSAATMSLRQAGNFNIGAGSVLSINPNISEKTLATGLNITGSGTTIFSGANTYSGRTTLSGGTLEIVGTNASALYTLSGANVPVLKLSNVNAIPVSADLTGSNSGSTTGTVDLAVAGAYTFGLYSGGNMGFTASSGDATTLEFTGASKITSGANGGRAFNNKDANLSIVFDSTLDIGGNGAGNVDIDSTGSTTVTGDVLSTGAGVRSLTKKGSGSLTLNGDSTYTGNTAVTDGKLVINGNISTSPLTTVSGTGTISGNGTTSALTIASGGTLSPGNSPGTLSTGNEIWQDGGNYNWQVLDATGAAGSGYDTIAVTGTLDLNSLTAGAFGINLWSLSSIGPDVNGDALNFNNALTQSWTILTTTGGITGFDAADFAIATGINNNTGGFSNIHPGEFSLGQSGDFKNLILTYTAVPEPTVAVLGGISLLGLLRRRRNG